MMKQAKIYYLEACREKKVGHGMLARYARTYNVEQGTVIEHITLSAPGVVLPKVELEVAND